MELNWISVKERLPDNEYCDCLVIVKVGEDYYVDLGGWTETSTYLKDIDKWISEWDWWVNNDWDEGQGCIVQYWAPLPPVPEEFRNKMIRSYDPYNEKKIWT